MRNFFERFLISAVLCLVCGNAFAMAPFRIIVYGDSLTSGYDLQPDETYASKLDRKLRGVGYDNLEVINMSQPTMTTSDAADKLSQVVAQHPDIVVLELGSTDAQRGVNNSLVLTNMNNILLEMRNRNIFVVMIGVKTLPGVAYGYLQQLEGTYSHLYDQWHVHFYPDALEGISGNPDLTLADGYHPNAKGMDALVENTYRMVDAGLRYKWSVIQFQEYQQQQNSAPVQLPDMSTPPPTVLGPASRPKSPLD